MEQEEKKIYTIEDITRELGVSKTTVSRAISGKGRIGRKTRERVFQFIVNMIIGQCADSGACTEENL